MFHDAWRDGRTPGARPLADDRAAVLATSGLVVMALPGAAVSPLDQPDLTARDSCKSRSVARRRKTVRAGPRAVRPPLPRAAWCMASLQVADAPARLRKGAGRYPQPMALLARLGVDRASQGRGLGAGLLADVIARTVDLGGEIGCRGLLIHAESSDARDLYLHLIPELLESPTDALHLVLLMKDIRRSLGP